MQNESAECFLLSYNLTEQTESAGPTHKAIAEEAEGSQRKRWGDDESKNKLFGTLFFMLIDLTNPNIWMTCNEL